MVRPVFNFPVVLPQVLSFNTFFQGIVHPDKEAKALSLQLASPCRNCSASENRFAVPDS
jgi:hypothetical protein